MGINQNLQLAKYLKDTETARRENKSLWWFERIKETLNEMKPRSKQKFKLISNVFWQPEIIRP